MNKDLNLGFSGLANLTSDDFLHPEARQEIYPTIDLEIFPTIPAPWTGLEEGKAWQWEDFIVTLQKSPDLFINTKRHIKSNDQIVSYCYAISVFYHPERKSHISVNNPIQVLALELIDRNKYLKIFNHRLSVEQKNKISSREKVPLVISHFSYQAYSLIKPFHIEDIEPNLANSSYFDVKKYLNPLSVENIFFEILKDILAVYGEPINIGNLANAWQLLKGKESIK